MKRNDVSVQTDRKNLTGKATLFPAPLWPGRLPDSILSSSLRFSPARYVAYPLRNRALDPLKPLSRCAALWYSCTEKAAFPVNISRWTILIHPAFQNMNSHKTIQIPELAISRGNAESLNATFSRHRCTRMALQDAAGSLTDACHPQVACCC